jgi:DNA processing protein
VIGVGARRDPQPREEPLNGASADRPTPAGAGWRALDMRAIDIGTDRPYWIALHALPGMGPVTFARLLHRFGTARGAWAQGERLIGEMPRPGPTSHAVLQRLMREGAEAVARRVSRLTMAAGGSIVTAAEPAYPRALTEVDPRPAVLHVAGDLTALDEDCVAIVGTRRASGYGLSTANHIADELARAGAVIVSGLALGIDGEAHRAAIAAGGRTVAVLPSPLGRIYPPRHRELARQLVATGGALISEIGPGQSTGRPDFARRNRIIAGLARAVVVVEAPNHSGALLTASAASAYGREIHAVPGPVDSLGSEGPNRLIADGQAEIVTSAASLVLRVGLRRPAGPVSVAALSESEGLVLGALLRRSASIEELIGPTRLPPGALAGTLTMLEARGLVTSYGGVTFHPTVEARRIGMREPRDGERGRA